MVCQAAAWVMWTLSYSVIDLIHVQVFDIWGEDPIEQLECALHMVLSASSDGDKRNSRAHNVQDLLCRRSEPHHLANLGVREVREAAI